MYLHSLPRRWLAKGFVTVPALKIPTDAHTGRSLRWKYACNIVDQLPWTLPRRSFEEPCALILTLI